jgi:hypothetical protein
MPDVPVQAVPGDLIDTRAGKHLVEVMVLVSHQDFSKVVAGTAYALVPENPDPDHQWKVVDGVSLKR